MITNGFKNTFLILNILIFNLIFSQKKENITLKNKDTLRIMKKDTIVHKSGSLVSIVFSKADSTRSDLPNKMSFLKKNAIVKYDDIEINADYISIDWGNSLVFARGELDSLGKVKTPAIANQGGKKYEYDSFSYNLKTKVAIAYNARTEESEGVIVAEKTKKLNDSIYYMRNAKYTTDEYFLKKKDTVADYYLKAPLLKLIKGKKSTKLVSGKIQMYIEDMPTPLMLPFAILPFSAKRSAGILIPSFGENQATGFYLQGLGYYQPLGERADLKILFDYSTKGSYAFHPEVNYKKKYRYSGNFNPDFSTTVNGIYGLDSYNKSNQFRILWKHQQDQLANPYFKFIASIDIVNSRSFYNRSVSNNYILNNNILNTRQSSSLSFVKNFRNLPMNLSANFLYNQNFSTGEVDMTLPQINLNFNQFYLFKPKSGVREGLLENINVMTSIKGINRIITKEEELFKNDMFKKIQSAVQNDISINTNTNLFKYFTFSVSANVNNVASNKTAYKTYDFVQGKLLSEQRNQLAGFSTFSTAASLQTILYGMLKFGKNSPVQAIRHMVIPSISFNYTPDFASPAFGYYSSYQDQLNQATYYSRFEGNPFGSPSQGLSQSISLSINNNLEMKIKSAKDSTGVKKIKIFENLSINANYNFAANSFKLSPITFSGQTSFYNNKINLNFGFVIDPYKISNADNPTLAQKIDQIGAFRVSSFNAQFTLPISNLIFGKPVEYSKVYKKRGEIMNENYYFDDDNYAAFSQDWNLNLNTNYLYTNNINSPNNHVATVGMQGNLKLSPHWNISGNGNLDLVTKKMAFGRFTLSRNLRSFQFAFNWSPFGMYKVYDFAISIKANILKDTVKYNERSFNQSNSSF